MEQLIRRVDALESDVKEIKADLKSLVREVAEIRGRLANMPTTFQLLSWFLGVAFGLVSLTFAIAKLV